MTTTEKEALLTYLEFNLTSMVEQLERSGIKNEQHVGNMYDAAYEVLHEMERTLNDFVQPKIVG